MERAQCGENQRRQVSDGRALEVPESALFTRETAARSLRLRYVAFPRNPFQAATELAAGNVDVRPRTSVFGERHTEYRPFADELHPARVDLLRVEVRLEVTVIFRAEVPRAKTFGVLRYLRQRRASRHLEIPGMCEKRCLVIGSAPEPCIHLQDERLVIIPHVLKHPDKNTHLSHLSHRKYGVEQTLFCTFIS